MYLFNWHTHGPEQLNICMPTVTRSPYTVTQTTTADQVEWQLTATPWTLNDHNKCGLTAPLRAVHNLANLSGTGNSGTLHWSGYRNISAVTSDGSTVAPVTAIQIRVYSDKRGRLLDRTIKLTVDGAAVGANLAKSTAGNTHTYTAAVPTDLTVASISTLGVDTEYKSGTQPHQDTMTVDTVQLLITYSTD